MSSGEKSSASRKTLVVISIPGLLVSCQSVSCRSAIETKEIMKQRGELLVQHFLEKKRKNLFFWFNFSAKNAQLTFSDIKNSLVSLIKCYFFATEC